MQAAFGVAGDTRGRPQAAQAAGPRHCAAGELCVARVAAGAPAGPRLYLSCENSVLLAKVAELAVRAATMSAPALPSACNGRQAGQEMAVGGLSKLRLGMPDRAAAGTGTHSGATAVSLPTGCKAALQGPSRRPGAEQGGRQPWAPAPQPASLAFIASMSSADSAWWASPASTSPALVRVLKSGASGRSQSDRGTLRQYAQGRMEEVGEAGGRAGRPRPGAAGTAAGVDREYH